MPPAPEPPPPEGNLLDLFVRPLHRAGLRYVVAGSVAAMYFSEPRLTLDVDIPIFLGKQELPILASLFSGQEFYCPPLEVLTVEAERECRGHFNVIHIPTGLKADFYPGRLDPTFAWAWKNRQEKEMGDGPVFLAPLEYVVLWKLIFYKEGKSQKHLRDIARILAVQKEWALQGDLMEEIRLRGLQTEWEEACSLV